MLEHASDDYSVSRSFLIVQWDNIWKVRAGVFSLIHPLLVTLPLGGWLGPGVALPQAGTATRSHGQALAVILWGCWVSGNTEARGSWRQVF